MHRTTLAALAAALALALSPALPSQALAQSGTLSVQAGDAILGAATERARARLAVFWRAHAAPAEGESRFALKVAFSEGDRMEQVWITQVERRDGRIVGRVNNKPALIGSLELGQRIEVEEADIADWLFMRDGKIVGNETLKALFARLPADKAVYFRSLHEAD